MINDFSGFSELSMAALSNDDMLAFLKDNRFSFKNKKGKREEEPLYTIEEYFQIREAFLEWIKD